MAKKKVETNKEQIAIELTLAPIIVTVDAGADKEVIERAKKAALEEIAKNFPRVQYRKVEIGALTQETVKCGMLVEEVGNPKNKGIVTAINQKTINVTLTGRRSVQGNATLFRLTNAPFEEVASFYKKFEMTQTTPDGEPIQTNNIDYFSEGSAGYLHNKGEITPVVIGKSKGSKYNLFVIGGAGRYFTLTEQQMKMFFKSVK